MTWYIALQGERYEPPARSGYLTSSAFLFKLRFSIYRQMKGEDEACVRVRSTLLNSVRYLSTTGRKESLLYWLALYIGNGGELGRRGVAMMKR